MTVNGVAPVEVFDNEKAGWETGRDKEDGGFINDHDFRNPKIPIIEIRPGPKPGPQPSRLTDLIERVSTEGSAPQNTVLEDIEESRRRVCRNSNQSRVLSPHSTRRYMISQENKEDDLRKRSFGNEGLIRQNRLHPRDLVVALKLPQPTLAELKLISRIIIVEDGRPRIAT